ncbi:MAG: succinate-semialdehyde dehydrogenase (NADP(+)) [Gammaproteobacteria bacterium RIFCSPHIGHO2_12_FULL_41_20]|nr:MAG: succinate-semialdehyde dehydrogenase (NADP(+)) [Gammaproteobacteria bacterium RIFCSPHIGHO2_12_FULL_41_20]
MHGLQLPTLFREVCYINGQWVHADSKKTVPVVNPYDNQLLGHVPACGAIETRRAIDAAQQAWLGWRALTAKQRADYLWQWAYLIDQHKEDLARLMTLEGGKPLTEARGEVDYGNAFIKWFAEEGRRLYGDVIPSNKPNQHLIVIKQPIGVVAAITPWNFPIAMITRKCAPALAAGCTLVIKPAEDTPFCALALAYLAEQAGIPAGVINVVTGIAKQIGGEMTANPLVRKLSFTGSTAVGKLLMQQCAGTVKKISLELGGNAPFIVFDDADLDAAVTGAVMAKFRNTGQTCVCANRILVQDSIYAVYSKKLVAAVQQLKVGNGLDVGVQQGPLINQAGLEKVKLHIADAVAKGATLQCGGKPVTPGGLLFEPTVLTEVTTAMRVAKEETFGPVAPLFRFHTEEEAIQMANDTEFGLASYVYTRDMSRIWRVSEELEYGMVGVNTGIVSTEVAPFGGYKESGIGREGSKYGIEDYVEIKYICMEG